MRREGAYHLTDVAVPAGRSAQATNAVLHLPAA